MPKNKHSNLNATGSAQIVIVMTGLLILALFSVSSMISASNRSIDQQQQVLGVSDSGPGAAETAKKSKGYAIVTRKYKDFDINYAVEKGLNTGMYPLSSDNLPPPCKQIKNEVLNKGRMSKTLWECTPGTWFAVPRDSDPNSLISQAYDKASTKSKYAIKIKIKSGKTTRAKALVLRKSDL